MTASWTWLAHEYWVLCKSTLVLICRKPWRRTWPWNNQLPYPPLHQSPGQLTHSFWTSSPPLAQVERSRSIGTVVSTTTGQKDHTSRYFPDRHPTQQDKTTPTDTFLPDIPHNRERPHQWRHAPWQTSSASWPDIPHYWDSEPNTC